jgi:hypothetical protein
MKWYEDVVATAYCTARRHNYTSLELSIPRETVRRILKAEKFHPYKLQILHKLTKDAKDVLRIDVLGLAVTLAVTTFLALSSITVGRPERGLSKTACFFEISNHLPHCAKRNGGVLLW